MKDTVRELYEGLKGTTTFRGQLKVDGFHNEDYEDLYFELLDTLKPYFEGDFYTFYADWVNKYWKFRASTNRNYDFYCPQKEKPIEEHSIREQLAVLKFFIYKRATSHYMSKIEKEFL